MSIGFMEAVQLGASILRNLAVCPYADSSGCTICTMGVADHSSVVDRDLNLRQVMGIGLAVSRSIVEAHGGRLWAENHPDRGGATVNVALPVSPKREVR